MSDTRNDTASVVERTHSVAASGPVIAVHFLRRTAVFVLGEEAFVFAEATGEPRRVDIHGGAILEAGGNDERIVSGGDAGKVIATDARAESRTLATDAKHRWIDHVA